PEMRDVPRLGLNLGKWTQWGAEQLMTNVLKNPGFEFGIDRSLITVSRADWRGFDDDGTVWGRDDGYWHEGRFDVRTGDSAGETGIIEDSRRRGRQGTPSFETRESGPSLARGTIVALTQDTRTTDPVAGWSVPVHAQGTVRLIADESRPGSPGRSCVRVSASITQSGELRAYLDSIGTRAGKLLRMNGLWRLSFWARAESRTGSNHLPVLHLRLKRVGGVPFVEKNIDLRDEWREYSFDFEGADDGPDTTITLSFATEGNGHVFVDDTQLFALKSRSSPFRKEVVSTLKTIRPGYLRDWQDQLGDSFVNRIAEPFARRPTRYRPDGHSAWKFHYSIPEFFDLCQSIGAQPWIVAPTTLSDSEFEQLGSYLTRERSARGFRELVLEFGNENWNLTFRPAGIISERACAQAADRAFSIVRRAAANPTWLRFAIAGQFVSTKRLRALAGFTKEAHLLAIAPYFLHSFDGTDTESALSALFRPQRIDFIPSVDIAKHSQLELSVAEVHLHTIQGESPSPIRRPLVAGAASATAVARRLIHALQAGVRRQCVYTFSGYDMQAGEEFVPLWGIVRDLSAPNQFRPSGLALTLLNRVVGGNYHVCRVPKGDLTAVAFRHDEDWRLAIASSSPRTQRTQIEFPHLGKLPRRQLWIDTSDPSGTNEYVPKVGIKRRRVNARGRRVDVQIPPYGLVILTR
ncbi:MAG: hypothetical protein AAF517_24530, partial [Planctomycetota bacterium]